jgi:hypothetical protein
MRFPGHKARFLPAGYRFLPTRWHGSGDRTAAGFLKYIRRRVGINRADALFIKNHFFIRNRSESPHERRH